MYSVEPPSLPEWGYALLEFRDIELQRIAAQKMEQFIQESRLSHNLIGGTIIRSGYPENQICLAADAQNTDLIVMAAHGSRLSTMKHAILGSTAERVVRHSPCPVLVFRENPRAGAPNEFTLKRIFLTTDFSAASTKAFPYATALARKFDASLTLVYVAPNYLPAELSHIGFVLEEKSLLEESRAKLPRFRVAELDASLNVDTLRLSGSPAYEICQAAEDEHADLIVIATHGYSGLKHFTMGSVAERVVSHAPCPVLVIR